MSKEQKRSISRIAVIAIIVAVGINLTTGIQNVWSVLGNQMISDYGWTTVQATLPYSLITFTSAIWSIVAGRWGDKSGHTYPIIFGGAMLGLGLIFSSMHHNPALMCITAGVMLGLSSSSMTCNTAGNTIQWTPPRYKGLASGLITSGFAISSFYMTPLINALLGKVGLHSTFRIMGIAAIIIIPVLAILLPDSKSKKHYEEAMRSSGNAEAGEDNAANKEDHSKYKNSLTAKQVLKTKEFWAIWCMVFFGNVGGQIVVSQAVTIAGVQVPTWTRAFILVMVVALANFAGRLIVPSLGDKIGVSTITKITMIAQAVNWFLFAMYRTPALMIVGCAILGFTFGSNVPMLWNWLGAVFGTKNISQLQGMGTTSWAIGGLLGPTFAAAIMDRTGSYNTIFIIAGIFCVIAMLLSFTIKNNYDELPDKKTAKAEA